MAENAQAKETGITPDQRQQEITAAYSQTDTAEAFQNALLEAGYILAQGDRRAFVVVDGFGKTHSLTRYVKGYKAKDIKRRLSSLDLAELPTVDEAREQMRQHQQAAEDRTREQAQSIPKSRTCSSNMHRSAWRCMLRKSKNHGRCFIASRPPFCV